MCGILGIFPVAPEGGSKVNPSHQEAVMRVLTSFGLRNLVDRGRDATGLAVFQSDDNGCEWVCLKQPDNCENFTTYEGGKHEGEEAYANFRSFMAGWRNAYHKTGLKTRGVLGHVRKATVGDRHKPENNHPIIIEDHILGVHNGTLRGTNDDKIFEIFKQRERAGVVDSEAVFHLLHAIAKGSPFEPDMLKSLFAGLDGAFTTLAVDSNNPHLVAVTRESRPLELIYLDEVELLVAISVEKFLSDAVKSYNTVALASGLNLPVLKEVYSRPVGHRLMFPDGNYSVLDLSKPMGDSVRGWAKPERAPTGKDDRLVTPSYSSKKTATAWTPKGSQALQSSKTASKYNNGHSAVDAAKRDASKAAGTVSAAPSYVILTEAPKVQVKDILEEVGTDTAVDTKSIASAYSTDVDGEEESTEVEISKLGLDDTSRGLAEYLNLDETDEELEEEATEEILLIGQEAPEVIGLHRVQASLTPIEEEIEGFKGDVEEFIQKGMTSNSDEEFDSALRELTEAVFWKTYDIAFPEGYAVGKAVATKNRDEVDEVSGGVSVDERALQQAAQKVNALQSKLSAASKTIANLKTLLMASLVSSEGVLIKEGQAILTYEMVEYADYIDKQFDADSAEEVLNKSASSIRLLKRLIEKHEETYYTEEEDLDEKIQDESRAATV